MELAQLAVFVRSPAAGSVKTRLHPALGERGAADLYSAFVEDTIALCERVRQIGRVEIALWADGTGSPEVQRWADALGAAPQVQPEGDLGLRLATAFDAGLRGHERVVIIGSDAPTLPLAHIVDAFNVLDEPRLAFGPSNDGGYYVIGASGSARPRFEGVRWSTEQALEDTIGANAEEEIALLPPWYDVDEPADLDILRAHLSVSPGSAPATARCLAALLGSQR